MSVIGNPLKPKHNQGCGENVHLKNGFLFPDNENTDTFVLGCLKFFTYRKTFLKNKKWWRNHTIQKIEGIRHTCSKMSYWQSTKKSSLKNTEILDTPLIV